MADFNFGELMDAGRNLIDNPPPGCVIDMHPTTVSAWLDDKADRPITVQLVKVQPETRAAVPVVVLTSGLDRAVKALTGAAAGMKPGETPVTAREIRLAGYAVRLAAVCRNLMANAPGGGFLSFGRSIRWDDAKAKAQATLGELVELDTAPVGRLDLPERAGGRSTAAEQVGERPVSTIPNIDPRQVAGEYIAGRQVPLILPNRPEDKASRDEAEAEAVLDSMGIRPTLPAGYTYVDRPAGAGGNRWQQRVRTWAGEELVAYGDTPREAVAAAVRAAQMHHQPPSRHAEEKAAAFGLPEGYTFAGNAWNAHAPGPWTHYVDHVASGKRLYGHGATPDEARADAVRVAKNHAAAAADSNGADIVDALRMRFDAQIVFPDEVARRAAAEIERLRRELDKVTRDKAPPSAGELAAELDARSDRHAAAIRERDAEAAALRRQIGERDTEAAKVRGELRDYRMKVGGELRDYRMKVARLCDKVPRGFVVEGADELDTLALTVANVLTGLEAYNRQPGDTPPAVRLAIDTLRTVTDHNATPRQMAADAERQPVLMRLLEDANKQLADLRAAVTVAGFGIMLLPGAVRLQDMRPEPADNDESEDDSDHSGTPFSDSEPESEDGNEADDEREKLRAELRALSGYVDGLRVLLNFAELRARALAWLMVNQNREGGGDADRAGDVARALEQMGKAVRATLTANAQRLGPLTAGQFAQAANAAAREVRLLTGERDHVAADFYALPLGFSGPREEFRY